MACHGEMWFRKHGICRVQVTRKDNALSLTLRRETLERDTDRQLNETFATAELEAGIQWNLAAGTIYSLFLTIVRKDASDPATAAVKLAVRDQLLVDNECSSEGEAISGDWQIVVFRASSP